MSERPIAIEMSGVQKSFRMPTHRVETLKERTLHPFAATEYTELRALEDISFEVRAGEFMGIAGRNGSGKTTLLKLLASVYRADRGRIRMAGRVAPFIELGVGFNPELAAEDNVLLNGVMMGLSPKQARERFREVIEFAELEDFAEMKLKNYSSGMRVRLGFAMLIAADADILLIDEVLAVGDASFQQKCTDTFYRLRDEGRTIVFVTHEMQRLEQYCDRAILLHEGRIDRIGDPEETAERYLELNFMRPDRELVPSAEPSGDAVSAAREPRRPARVVDFWLEDDSGERADRFRNGDPINLVAVVEAAEELEGPGLGFEVRNAAGVSVFDLRAWDLSGAEGPLRPGERMNIRLNVDNPLSSGQYAARVALTRNRSLEDVVDLKPRAAEFLVYGVETGGGNPVVTPAHRFWVTREHTRELTAQ
jgi:ABC-2 type transport system ATP-binding protein